MIHSVANPRRSDDASPNRHHVHMKRTNQSHEETIERIKEVRAQAIEHTRQARKFHVERQYLIQQLIDDGWFQADIGRELGVTRQAIQKMLS
jgi:transcriptional regulator with GAF, ATPase, and Fis domain